MDSEHKHRAIKEVIRRQNPFYANHIIPIRHQGLHHLWYNICTNRFLKAVFLYILQSVHFISQLIVIKVGLLIGLILTAINVAIPTMMVIYALDFDPTKADLLFKINPSWSDYLGWLVMLKVLFLLPYWLWGLTLTSTLYIYRPFRRLYIRQRLRNQLLMTHRDQPYLLQEQIKQHQPRFILAQPPLWLKLLRETGNIAGSITGILAALIFVLLYARLIIFMWQQSNEWHFIALITNCLIIIYTPRFLIHSYRSGRAVSALVTKLAQGDNYRYAIRETLRQSYTDLFKRL